jgi:hypothetical protein
MALKALVVSRDHILSGRRLLLNFRRVIHANDCPDRMSQEIDAAQLLIKNLSVSCTLLKCCRTVANGHYRDAGLAGR